MRKAHSPLRALIRRAWEANPAALRAVGGVISSCAAAGQGDGGDQFVGGSESGRPRDLAISGQS